MLSDMLNISLEASKGVSVVVKSTGIGSDFLNVDSADDVEPVKICEPTAAAVDGPTWGADLARIGAMPPPAFKVPRSSDLALLPSLEGSSCEIGDVGAQRLLSSSCDAVTASGLTVMQAKASDIIGPFGQCFFLVATVVRLSSSSPEDR